MHSIRKQRLIIAGFITVSTAVAVGLISFALKDNINLFYAPTEIAQGKAPVGKRIRIGGMVIEGSVQRATDDLQVRFIVTDYQHSLPVVYAGVLPDLFAENQGVVATGYLREGGSFEATQVLAKHDENYMPREVQAVLQ